jgi:hypothetical protein
MQAGLGLVGLLIGVFILMYIWSQNAAVVTTASKQATADAQQFAGRDEDGVPVKESVKLDPFVRPNGKVSGVMVADVTAGGAMEKYYGLKRGDVIVAAGQMDLRDQDDDMAMALIFQEGYQKKGQLRVKRGLKEIMLPGGEVISDASPQPAQPTTPAVKPATPTEKPTPTAGDHAKQPEPERPAGQSDTRSALRRQLDALPGVQRNE